MSEAEQRMDDLFRLASAAEVPDDAWKTRLQWTSSYKGIAGLDDKFMHLSTAEQVVSTAELYFNGRSDVVLLRFSVESMREEADLEVRWEDSKPAPGVIKRDGAFPHVYGGQIPYACLVGPPALLELGPDGKHVFPLMGAAAAAAAEAESLKADDNEGVDEAVERGMDDEDGYDGCAATGMYG